MNKKSITVVPTVGSEVRVRVKNPFASRMIPPSPEITEYQGRVLDPYRWLTDREFCLEGNDAWPIRVINTEFIENLELLSGSQHEIDTTVRTWKVLGSRGNEYLVTREHRGWSCSCPGFQFRKNCRHITELSLENEEIAR